LQNIIHAGGQQHGRCIEHHGQHCVVAAHGEEIENSSQAETPADSSEGGIIRFPPMLDGDDEVMDRLSSEVCREADSTG
jgi:hypothetical protein